MVSDASALASQMRGHSQIVVANYRFQLDPGQWVRHGTIMLVKNCGKTLLELIADTNTWVLGAQFNVRPELTQARLQAIADDALASTDPLMAPFQAVSERRPVERRPVPVRVPAARRPPARDLRARRGHRPQPLRTPITSASTRPLSART